MTRLIHGLKLAFSATLSLALLGSALPSRADNIQTLSDQNSSVAIDLSSQAGMYQWSVDGNNYLAQQWFWYRIGTTGPEASINTLSLTSVTNLGSELFTTYNGTNFTVSVTYTLNGSAPGNGSSHINESINVANTSGGSLDMHFFQFSHFTLAGANTVTLGRGGFGNNFDEAFQTGGGGAALTENVDAVNTPGANHGEAAFFPQTLNELNDAFPTTLNDHTNAGPGDVTWALEWDKTLTASGIGSSLLISKDKYLQVPEPAVVALISLGLTVCAFRRRRR
jgi:hypothetical protein